MKKDSIKIFILIVLVGLPGFGGFAQELPVGVTQDSWERMGKRWHAYMSWAKAERKAGGVAEGQVILVTDSTLVLMQNASVPLKADPEELVTLRWSEIESLKLTRGGHPYQGLIIGALAGAVPGAVTGVILAQGWTIIPGIVLGAVTAAGGGVAGSWIQRVARREAYDSLPARPDDKTLGTLRKTAVFENGVPDNWIQTNEQPLRISRLEEMLPDSKKLQQAFPDPRWSLSVTTGLLTNNVRKKLQVWFLEPMLGPPTGYYETRIALQADITRRIGNRFETGLLVNIVPGDISYSYFDKFLPAINLSYGFNHIFKQYSAGIYGGLALQPTDRFFSHRLRGSLRAGAVISDIYEHMYLYWSYIDGSGQDDRLIQEHHFKPGGFIRMEGQYDLIPGFALNVGVQGFWIAPVHFEQRTLFTSAGEYGSLYVTSHKINFSSWQWSAGFTIRL